MSGTPELRAFATRTRATDWGVAFYELREGEWTRLDPLFAPTGYDEPQIVGDPPMLTMRLRSADVPFRFRREGAAMVFESTPPLDLGDATDAEGLRRERASLLEPPAARSGNAP